MWKTLGKPLVSLGKWSINGGCGGLNRILGASSCTKGKKTSAGNSSSREFWHHKIISYIFLGEVLQILFIIQKKESLSLGDFFLRAQLLINPVWWWNPHMNQHKSKLFSVYHHSRGTFQVNILKCISRLDVYWVYWLPSLWPAWYDTVPSPTAAWERCCLAPRENAVIFNSCETPWYLIPFLVHTAISDYGILMNFGHVV